MRHPARLLCSSILLCACGGTPSNHSGRGSPGSAGGSGGSTAQPAGGSSTDAKGGTSTGGGQSTVSGGTQSSGGTTGSSGSNAGGSAGAVDLPDPVVLPCDSLSEVGTWEKVTPDGVNFTQDFGLDPLHPGTVYLGAAAGLGGAGGIYKSTDCGATWAMVATGENSDVIVSSPGHWTLTVDFADPDIVYTANGYGAGGVYKSTNGGVDWSQVVPADVLAAFPDGGHVERIAMDPTNHLHLTVTPHFACVGAHEGSCILRTTDGGTSWTVLDDQPPGGEDTGQMMLDSQHWLYAASDWHMYQTTDAGASWQQVFEGWTADQDIYQATDGSYYLAAEAGGVITSPDGFTWSSIPDSPQSIRAVSGDGIHIFTSSRRDCDACQPYRMAAEDDPTTWTNFESPPLPRGGWRLHYDTDHSLLYSSTETNGLWRVVTK